MNYDHVYALKAKILRLQLYLWNGMNDFQNEGIVLNFGSISMKHESASGYVYYFIWDLCYVVLLGNVFSFKPFQKLIIKDFYATCCYIVTIGPTLH